MSIYSRPRKDGTTAWFFDIMINGVRYREVGGTNRTQALRAQEKLREDVLNGKYNLAVQKGQKKIEKFAETFLARRSHMRSHKRDDLSVRTLLKFFKGRSLSSITPSSIEDYIIKRRADGVSNGTINRELACLKRMFSLAVKWRDASENPVKDVELLEEPPGRTRYLSEQEAQKLLEASNKYLRPIIFTALNTGMRSSEILSLKWQQVHIDSAFEPYIEITKTKNNKPRFVPLNDDMVVLLESLRTNESQYVFLSRTGKPVSSVRKGFQSTLARAEIEDFRFHDLRHTFASHFIMRGGDLLTLKEILGHSSLKMVQRYTHLAAAHKTRQVNNLSGIYTNCHLFATSQKMPPKLSANGK